MFLFLCKEHSLFKNSSVVVSHLGHPQEGEHVNGCFVKDRTTSHQKHLRTVADSLQHQAACRGPRFLEQGVKTWQAD